MEQTQKNIQVLHKFGGTSVANADRFKNINQILNGENEIIVVSAIKGTTQNLQNILDVAQKGENYLDTLQSIENKHFEVIKNLLPENEGQKLINSIYDDIQKIKDILQAVRITLSYSKEIQEIILGFGEQWSAKILALYLSQKCNVLYIDASLVLFISEKNGIIAVDWEKSKKTLDFYLQDKTWDKLVITGFIASTLEGKKTTLGRNGSDFSAAIFAKLLNAKNLYIWTDVEGIFSADPQIIRSAFPIESMSYQEAVELAYFGSKMIHPMAIASAIDCQIPIYIKNSCNPKSKSTCISALSSKSVFPITAISSIENIALINVEGSGMIGVSGIASRVFQIMHKSNISVILISQASSEHSICFAIHENFSKKAVVALNEDLQFEIEHRQIEGVFVDRNCSILAVVGDAMIGKIGVSGKLCSTLAKANINIRAISQGSSERNISIVVAHKDLKRAMQSVHSGFYLAPKTISIGIIGPGLVGGTLLKQIKEVKEEIKNKYQANLFVRGIMDSKKMILSFDSVNLNKWQENLANSNSTANLELFASHILSDDVPQAIIIDCTSNEKLAYSYDYLLQRGIHIITPNKKANSGDYQYYKKIKSLARENNLHYLYEATVCAGLPVINTIQDLIKTGDEVLSLEGVFSGTLSFIFNEMATGKSFSQAVFEAKKLGYTEPDPRDDLSGMDVARKLVCLAREVGYDVSLSDVKVQNLVPQELQSLNLQEFLTHLPLFDKQMADLANQNKNNKLSYVASIKKKEKLGSSDMENDKKNSQQSLKVSIESLSKEHPLYRLQGADNMIIIYTKRYCKQPLVIQGPGAGAEVTAAGVFADLLRFVTFLS